MWVSGWTVFGAYFVSRSRAFAGGHGRFRGVECRMLLRFVWSWSCGAHLLLLFLGIGGAYIVPFVLCHWDLRGTDRRSGGVMLCVPLCREDWWGAYSVRGCRENIILGGLNVVVAWGYILLGLFGYVVP